MTYDRIKSCYHFIEKECPHQRFLHIVCLFPQLLGREKYAKYHKALLDCLYCGQFIKGREQSKPISQKPLGYKRRNPPRVSCAQLLRGGQ